MNLKYCKTKRNFTRLIVIMTLLLAALSACGNNAGKEQFKQTQEQNGYEIILASQPAAAGSQFVNTVLIRILMSVVVLALVLCLFFLFRLLQIKRSESRRLEDLVKARTAELQKYQNDLEKALIAAQNASRSKSAFIANMSHEIRTPMNSIMGFSELALDGDISLLTRDYLKKIILNGEWLLQIINNILDISKIESGNMELEKIPLDIHDLFISCRTLVMPKAVEKGILLHFYAEPSVGKRPLGDPTRLRQVFVNLLSNAIKYTNTGMVKILSDITEISEKTITMHFEIKDSGIGMTKEQIDKIYEPFAQEETDSRLNYGGTGLGLAITRNIIEMMGGNLIIESLPSIGSKFSFDLTFDTIDISDKDRFEHKVIFNELEKQLFESEILLCEDNAMNQQVICEHLARVGIKTVVAENGQIGVDMVKSRMDSGEKQFDLVFMDMHMPVMDGLEAASKIIEFKTGIPIVAMTANIMSNDREIYRMSGLHDCVGKPFTSQELWRCLLKYLTPVNRRKEGENAQESGNSKDAQALELDTKFLRSLNELFIKNNRNKAQEIIQTLQAQDIKLAHRLAHTLKTSAGQIGKILLQRTAAVVENRLKDGKNLVTEEQLKILENELAMVISQLSEELAQNPEDAPVKSQADKSEMLDTHAALELIDKLELMIDMGNPESLNNISSILRIDSDKELIFSLIQQMEDYNFDQALISLGKIKKGLN